MKITKVLISVSFLFIILLSSCSKAQDNRSIKDAVAPVSVMEDNNVEKYGEMELISKDIEKTRKQLYELTKKYEGYIYYECSSTNSDYETVMQINIALYNDAFLDYFNEARTYGTLSRSEIRASLTTNIANYDPNKPLIDASVKNRASTINITINKNKSFRSCIKSTIDGLNNVFYSISPGIIILYILALIFSILFLISYVFYYCVIKKIYIFIKKRIPKS